MKYLLSLLSSAQSGRSFVALWRIAAWIMIVAAYFLWPRAFEPLGKAFISMALLLAAAVIMEVTERKRS